MKLAFTLSATFALLACAPLAAQQLQSNAFTYSGNRMTIGLKMTGANPGISFGVAVSPAAGLAFATPATASVDARGYASVSVDVTSTQANLGPRSFTVTLTHPTFSGGQITKTYIVKAVNGAIGSAWPEFIMAQGVFCNPNTSAATMLEVDRASDLDGDGLYGDTVLEAIGRDPLDSPSEFSSDVDLADGVVGCVAGTGPGVFQPGGGTRNVAFMADNRVVVGACNFTSALNFLEDMSFSPNFGGSPALLSTSSSSDNVLIARDSNGDGSLDNSEIRVFFSPTTLVNNENYSPDGVAWDPTGTRRAYWISDKAGTTGSPTNQGIFRLTDTNGDDQIAAGEFNAAWTGTTGVVVVEGQNVDHTEFECLHVDSFGGVLVNQTSLGTIFRWVDANNNGVAETGEVLNWLTYAATSAYTRSADFQTASFPTIAGPFFAFNLIESVEGAGLGGRDVYFVACTNSATAGQGNGHVFRCEDRNIDGDVNDVGEVTIFSAPALITDPLPPNFISGMDAGTVDLNGNNAVDANEIFVYVATSNGPRPFCGFPFADLCNWRFVDQNGDGDAVDTGENERISIHPTGAFNRGLEVLPDSLSGGFRHTFYSRSGLVTLKPATCVTATGESIEIDFLREKIEEGTQGTPFGGNARFALQTRGNGASAVACGLLLSGSLAPAPLPFNGCNVWVGFPFFADLIPATTPDATGTANFPLPVPVGTVATLILQPFAVSPSLAIHVGETAELRAR